MFKKVLLNSYLLKKNYIREIDIISNDEDLLNEN